MAIEPGDSRLPRYLEGNALPIWRKQSSSQATVLYLMHRDYWADAHFQYNRRINSQNDNPPLCTSLRPPKWKAGHRPEHNGFIEGVAHVNPWMLKWGSYVYVEVEARYRFHRSELDAFDFENDQTIFKSRIQLNPPRCFEEGPKCFSDPPKDLDSYSPELRQLYEKLGGACGSDPLKYEKLTAHGVVLGQELKNRMEHTFVPHTEATTKAGYPDLPYVTYNFPFRFDINRGPDSLMIKSNKPAPNGSHPVPKTRHELQVDAVYGFAADAEDSDPEAPSTSESDEDFNPRIRHPRQPVKKRHGVRKIDLRMQSYRDRYHKDCYPWRPRQKTPPKAGIYWTVRLYATPTPTSHPDSKHLAELTIRKLTYLPMTISLHNRPPPLATSDYSLAVAHEENTDAGVITLNAKLDKMFYGPGEPVIVSIKIHNTSNRVVQQLTVDVNQCIRISSMYSRVWRNTICRREITAENSDAEMPILPGTEQLRLSCRMNPWPVEEQYEHLFYDKLHKARPPKVPIEAEAFTLRMPLTPGIFYAVQQPGRYEEFPQTFILKRKPAFSTLPGVMDKMLENDVISIKKPQPPGHKNPFDGDPYAHCRCFKGAVGETGGSRSKRMPQREPYQHPLYNRDVIDEEEDRNYQSALEQMLAPRCARCGGCYPSDQQPVYVSYEVVVSAKLRPQNTHDPLAQDVLLNACKLGSGLLVTPSGHLSGKNGPRVSLPLLYTLMHPEPDMELPVANCNVDQRQDRPPKFPPQPKVWEPSNGKGFFLSKMPPKEAPCITGEEMLLM